MGRAQFTPHSKMPKARKLRSRLVVSVLGAITFLVTCIAQATLEGVLTYIINPPTPFQLPTLPYGLIPPTTYYSSIMQTQFPYGVGNSSSNVVLTASVLLRTNIARTRSAVLAQTPTPEVTPEVTNTLAPPS